MSILNSLIGPVTGLLDKFIEDKDKKNQIAYELSTMAEKHAQELLKGQLEVNKTEAAHKSLFVAGWRPAIGWICGFSIGYHFILEPIIQYILIVNAIQFETPEFDFSQLSTIVMAMLGMSGLRSYEKTKGVHSK